MHFGNALGVLCAESLGDLGCVGLVYRIGDGDLTRWVIVYEMGHIVDKGGLLKSQGGLVVKMFPVC